jgi:hypothetical protein
MMTIDDYDLFFAHLGDASFFHDNDGEDTGEGGSGGGVHTFLYII